MWVTIFNKAHFGSLRISWGFLLFTDNQNDYEEIPKNNFLILKKNDFFILIIQKYIIYLIYDIYEIINDNRDNAFLLVYLLNYTYFFYLVVLFTDFLFL